MTIRPSTWMLLGFSGIVVYLMYTSARRTGGAPATLPTAGAAPLPSSTPTPFMPASTPAATAPQPATAATPAATPADQTAADTAAAEQAFLQGISPGSVWPGVGSTS